MAIMGAWRTRAVASLVAAAVLALTVISGVEGASRNSPTSHVFASSESLLGKPGGTGLIRADEVTYDTQTKIVTAAGHVEIDYNGRILLADKIVYDQVKDVATADGRVSVLEPDGSVGFAEHAVLTNKMRDGVAEAFSALLGKMGRFAAIRATRTKNGTILTGVHGVYTSCKICKEPGKRTPLWQIRAAKVVYNQPEHEITYHDATFELFGVPVAYTPYFSQPDPSVKRKSGLLVPELGSSTLLGSFVRLPIYVALNDSQDMTFSPMFTTSAGVLVEGEYRQRWDRGGMWLQASAAENPHGGPSENENQYYASLFGSGRIPLWDNVWKLGFDAQLTTNKTFLRRYDLSILDRLVNDLFLEGIEGRSRFLLTGYYFEGLRVTDKQAFFPIVAPLMDYTYVPEHDVLWGQFQFHANTAVITRQLGPTSQRASAEARWRLPLISGDGQLITVQADVRGDVFRVNNNDVADFPDIPVKTNYISRGLPYAALDWRWPFVAGNNPGGTAFVLTPIVQAIAAPYGGNPKGIPNEDSSDFELDDNNIFSFEHLPGYSLVETGPRANAGFDATALFPSGGSVELLLGEAFRLKPDPNFGPIVGFEDKTSDVVGRFTIKFPPHFSLTHRVDIDQTTGNFRRNEVYLDGTWGRSVLEVSYLNLSQQEPTLDLPAREEVNAQATIGLFDHWAVFAGARRDLENDRMIDDEFGVGYEDECLAASISYRRNYTTQLDVPPSTSILLRFQLKTGQPETPSELFPRHIFTTQ